MKKNFLFYLVFFSVFLCFVIPPIVGAFFTERQEAFVARYPFSVFLNGIIAFLIYHFSQRRTVLFSEMPLSSEKKPFFVYLSAASVSFGVLCLSSVVFEILSVLTESESGIHTVIFPDSVLGKVNFFFGVIFAAFFEEVIYRFFLPSAFFEIFKGRHLSRTVPCNNDELDSHKDNESTINLNLSVICEIPALLLFAAGHLYLGVFGFLNALVCGIALRVCMAKMQSLWIPFGLHAIYNFLSLYIISL